jgi:hypothetical protein
MNGAHLASTAGAVTLLLHLAALIKDGERYQANLARWQADPTRANLLRFLLAEGILVKDLGWLL